MVLSFLTSHAETIIAILALVIALQANLLARRSKSDSDRLLLSQKKRDLLQEIDRQHVTMLRLRYVVQDELLQFELCPQIELVQPGEREGLKNNAEGLDTLEHLCLEARKKAETINIGHDPAQIDVQFSEVGRLMAHLQKDLEHEQSLLQGKKNLVRTAPEAFRKT